MLLQYGPISLNLLELKEYRQEDLYDGPSYLATEVTLVLRAVYNPATQGDGWGTSPRYQADNTLPIPYVPRSPVIGTGVPSFSPPGGPVLNTQIPGAVTNSALRHLLLQPRQQLVFSVGGVPSIVSPLPPAPADVMNGPIPLACNVQEIQGTRTWIVDYAIKTYLNECPIYGSPFPLVLAHVWTMRHELDQDYFTSQVIEGRFTLRADSLGAMDLPPDFFRSQLLPLPNPAFKRERVDVWYEAQAPNVLNYRVVDRQLPIGWAQAGVTRVQATHTVSSDSYPIEAQLGALFGGAVGEGIIDRIGEALGGHSKLGIGRKLLAGGAAFVATLPQTRHSIVVDVWGDGTSTRNGLEAFGMNIVSARLLGLLNILNNNGVLQDALAAVPVGLRNAINAVLNGLPAGAGVDGANPLQALGSMLYGYHRLVTHQLEGKHVHIEWGLASGPLLSLVTPFATARINAGANRAFPATDDTLPALIVNGNSVNGFNGGCQIFQWPPPGDGSSRSDWLGLCLGAALQSPCELPSTPAPTLPNAGLINPCLALLLPAPAGLKGDGDKPSGGDTLTTV